MEILRGQTCGFIQWRHYSKQKSQNMKLEQHLESLVFQGHSVIVECWVSHDPHLGGRVLKVVGFILDLITVEFPIITVKVITAIVVICQLPGHVLCEGCREVHSKSCLPILPGAILNWFWKMYRETWETFIYFWCSSFRWKLTLIRLQNLYYWSNVGNCT